MEVRVLSTGRVLWNHLRVMGAVVPAFCAPAFVPAAITIRSLEKLFPQLRQATVDEGLICLLVVDLIWVAVFLWCLSWVCAARSRLALEGDALVIRRSQFFTRERRIPLGEVERVEFGAELSEFERVLGVLSPGAHAMKRSMKQRLVRVVCRDGRSVTSGDAGLIFDLGSLLEFAAELSRRGVAVRSPAGGRDSGAATAVVPHRRPAKLSPPPESRR